MLWRLNDGALHVALGPLAYRRGFGRSDLCLACNEVDVSFWGPKQTLRGHPEMSALKDGVIGRPSLWIAEDFWVLRFRLMVKRGPWLRPQASEGEAQHGPFWRIGRIGQGDEHLHCG
jgi:hypothetical protein